jgi:FlaA1/EpsC-like NDP-sugar epimerase
MVNRIQSYIRVFFRHIFSRWLVFGLDLLLVAFSFCIAYLLRFNFELSEISLTLLLQQTLIYTLVWSISFLIFSPHSGIVRHTGLHESFIVFIAVSTPLWHWQLQRASSALSARTCT